VSSELRATYRIQLRADFDFDDAAALVPYLADLGVSHLYVSPCTQAAAGSLHGYDVVDPRRLNEELGGEEGFARLRAAIDRAGMGLVIDFVSNHMAVTKGNPWWWDVLENGPSSRYAPYFDVDWEPPEPRLHDAVMLPVLGDHYGRILEAGELRLERDGGAFVVRYHDQVFPVSPPSLSALLGSAAERCGSAALGFLAESHEHLPASSKSEGVDLEHVHRNKEALRDLLARLLREDPAVAAAVDEEVTAVNADHDALDVLLEAQNYRLAFWRSSRRDLGYRRFFDVNALAAIRVEDPRVFEDVHELILRLCREGSVEGLRIDHPDGLRDPEEYFRRLRDRCPEAWIVVEKILAPDEKLRESWPVDGSTGYDFLNRVNGLFVDPEREVALTELYADFTGETTDYGVLVREKKHQVVRDVLGSDVVRLTALFLEVCEQHRRYRDYTRHELHEALREVLAGFSVYRTYVRARDLAVTEEDVRYVTEAVEAAKVHRPDVDAALFDFLRDVLLLRVRGTKESELVMAFQQVTGPVMAKAVEDTAFYSFNRLLSLNEVGGDPRRFGVTAEEFHAAAEETLRTRPYTMLATSTHDTKRSEDVRARLNLLAEIPARWAEAIQRWSARNARYRREGLPDRNAEYHLYQTLVGAWPIDTERLSAYMEKAAREAKVHTTWTDPNVEYEETLREFARAVLGDAEFVEDFETFLRPLIGPGRVNSLAQVLLKLTAPGIPDLYRGSEVWDLSLVDPDNRRPVDFERRRAALEAVNRPGAAEVPPVDDEGLAKIWLIQRTLALRRRDSEAFGPDGSYAPLAVRGPRAQHVVAYVRAGRVAVVVPRLVLGLEEGWGDTSVRLPSGGSWGSELTAFEAQGGEVRLDEILSRFPVELLRRKEGS
jgi:(1->4)-alpha-D-glucan 1-alpha-D-glucosylmutase